MQNKYYLYILFKVKSIALHHWKKKGGNWFGYKFII